MATKILLVDDEADFIYFLKANLKLQGDYEVITATDGESALELAKEMKPDLIFLDLIMPGTSGMDVLRRISLSRELYGNVPILILSAKRDTQTVLEAQKLGARDYLMKPVTIDELARLVRKYA